MYYRPICRIYAPWLLEIDKNSCLGPRSEVYNLGPVKIGKEQPWLNIPIL